MLQEDWYEALQATIQRGMKNKHVPSISDVQQIGRFFNSVGLLMSLSLQDTFRRSLREFEDSLCGDGLFPGIRLYVVLNRKRKLTLQPNFDEIRTKILGVLEYIVSIVKSFPRIDSKCIPMSEDAEVLLLRPHIPCDVIEECRRRVCAKIDEARIEPEQLLSDFEAFASLIDGRDAEEIQCFIETGPEFKQFQERIERLKAEETQISQRISCVVSGFFELHSEEMISILEELVRNNRTTLLNKLMSQLQEEMIVLQLEHWKAMERIKKKACDVDELTEQKAFVERIQADDIPEGKKRLKIVRSIRRPQFCCWCLDILIRILQAAKRLTWLMDRRLSTAIERKRISVGFQQHFELMAVCKQFIESIDDRMKEVQV